MTQGPNLLSGYQVPPLTALTAKILLDFAEYPTKSLGRLDKQFAGSAGQAIVHPGAKQQLTFQPWPQSYLRRRNGNVAKTWKGRECSKMWLP
jgi:hypothetical protein